MTTETTTTTALGAAAAGTETKAEPVVDASKTAATGAGTETKLTAEQQAKVTADAAALEAAGKPFTDVAQLKLAEGVKLDEASVKGFLEIAKDHGLTAKQAQALVDFNLKGETARAAAQAAAFDAADKAAFEALKADKEIGGAKFEASMALAGKAMRNVLGADFAKWATSLELKDGSLLGNRVEFARALVNLGAKVAEDSKAGTHSNGAKKEAPLAELLYGPGTVEAGPRP